MGDPINLYEEIEAYYYGHISIIEVVNRDHEFITWVGPRIMRVEGHA